MKLSRYASSTAGVLLAVTAIAAGSERAAAAPGDPAAKPVGKPNVLFIAVDDLNHWVGYLGRNRQTITPNLDRLAGRGVWFTRSYCAAPVCNPSRAALMSGLRPGASAVYDNADDFRPRIPPEITLCTAFRKAGYFDCGAGKIYHGSAHRPEEWDDYLGRIDRTSEDKGRGAPVLAGKLDITPLDCADEAMPDHGFVNYGIEQLNRKHEKPFFLAVGITKPHLPWSVPRKYYEMHPLEKIELPPYREDDLSDLPPIARQMARSNGDHEAILKAGTETWKQAIRAYLAAITFCDAEIGRLMDAFDKSAYRDTTIVCFWSDHGWHLGEKHHWRKFALWEETTRAPHIWVVPGLTPPNGRCDRTVDYMSIYPTLCDLCGIPVPAHVQGKSIRALLADPKAPWSEPAITTYRFENHTVRTPEWRYTRYADGGEELYDETGDPYEWTNLAGLAGQETRKAEMGRWLPKDNMPGTAMGTGGGRRNRKAR